MWKNFVKKLQTFFVVLLVGMLSLVMGVIGFSTPTVDGCSFSGANYAAEVYGHTITEGDYAAALSLRNVDRLRTSDSRTDEVRELILEGLIERQLLVHEAEALGYTAPESEDVFRQVIDDEYILLGSPVDVPAAYRNLLQPSEVRLSFRDRNGEFSEDYLRNFIQNRLHRSVAEFIEWQQAEHLASNVRDAVTANVMVSPREAWEAYVDEIERAQLSYLKFDRTYYLRQVEMTDEAVRAWMGENEEPVNEEYQRVRHRYTGLAPQTRAQHILIQSSGEDGESAARERAEAVLARIQAGEDFAVVAQETSDDSFSRENGGMLPWMSATRSQGVPWPFSEEVFELEADTLHAEVIQTDRGFHIVKVLQHREGDVPEDEAKLELAEALYRRARAAELAEEQANRALAYLSDGHSMDELQAALARNWEAAPEAVEGEEAGEQQAEETAEADANDPLAPRVAQTRRFGRTEQAISGVNSSDITAAAFEMSTEEPLPEAPVEIGDAWYVFRLDERTAADEEDFTDDVRERVEGYLLAVKRQEALIAYIADLRQRAERSGSIRVNEASVNAGSDTDNEAPEQSASR